MLLPKSPGQTCSSLSASRAGSASSSSQIMTGKVRGAAIAYLESTLTAQHRSPVYNSSPLTIHLPAETLSAIFAFAAADEHSSATLTSSALVSKVLEPLRDTLHLPEHLHRGMGLARPEHDPLRA